MALGSTAALAVLYLLPHLHQQYFFGVEAANSTNNLFRPATLAITEAVGTPQRIEREFKLAVTASEGDRISAKALSIMRVRGEKSSSIGAFEEL